MKNRIKYMVPDPPEPGYQSLANAWLATTFSDLRLALRSKGPAAEVLRQNCIDFLCSDFAGSLTGVDLPALVKKVIEEEKSLGGVNG